MFAVVQTLVLTYLFSVVYARSLSGINFLRPRQTSIPDTCTDTCGTVPDNLPNCFPNFVASKCCVNSFQLELYNCYQCIGSTQNISSYTLPQETLDQLFGECAAAGLPVNKLTLPGQDPNRAIPTLPISASPSSISTQSRPSSTEQSVSQNTVTSPSTPTGTPRSPVTETSDNTFGSATTSGAQTSPTNNAGFTSKNVDIPLLGLVLSAVMTISTIYALVL
ncbi:hypothetical protein K435DRAFT_443739 [Dendrothele bispora CBS 962.96]|uniref:Extracellular membrane protein CFEM domain-containing protein n=1 Tax=Dendrothele bispora (strain CBS 962.96) TaxID=1314807 RepID=A0A4S8MDG9_DENBC|nr:hypothetical protein K435DRAFT_443739 [Dendrothele bispora CBS 962.96]